MCLFLFAGNKLFLKRKKRKKKNKCDLKKIKTNDFFPISYLIVIKNASEKMSPKGNSGKKDPYISYVLSKKEGLNKNAFDYRRTGDWQEGD